MKIVSTLPSATVLALLLAACQPGNEEGASAPTANPSSGGAAAVQKLAPLPGKVNAPPALTEVTTVRLATTAGEVVIEVYPQAAPNAAKRFVDLVRPGLYDYTPVSRVVPGFVAQFGINWRDPHEAWDDRQFNDGRVRMKAIMGKQTLGDLSRNEQVEISRAGALVGS